MGATAGGGIASVVAAVREMASRLAGGAFPMVGRCLPGCREVASRWSGGGLPFRGGRHGARKGGAAGRFITTFKRPLTTFHAPIQSIG